VEVLVDNQISERQYVRTITTGWRFTLPAQIRKIRGWDEGTVLRADVAGDSLVLNEAGDQSAGMICYLGSGGKVVIPVQIRETLQWSLGERLAIRNEPHGVVLTACCRKDRCRPCGKGRDVSEVIENLFLCSECWNRYVQTIMAKRSGG
jgi:bifunctional DNA-binding transcriptional regulator/antitoxin component of YhaV-PrlF toxin-antitoxin module